jgi:hypothetical protein
VNCGATILLLSFGQFYLGISSQIARKKLASKVKLRKEEIKKEYPIAYQYKAEENPNEKDSVSPSLM